MFCPNCGTQNPDAAQTCSKCSFHLRGAAAPKFKGTMLMMNQPGAAPGAPVPRPPGAGALPGNSKLKGTMVGVAPPQPQQYPGQAGPASPLQGGAGARVGSPAEGASYSPPVPQVEVNPLGGTVAADASAFAPPPGVAAPYGAPPYGGPPQGPPHGFGPPPDAVPAPPGYAPPPPFPYASPAAPYAAPPTGNTGPTGFKTPVQGMMPYGAPPNARVGTLASQAPAGLGPTRRDAKMTMVRPGAVTLGGLVLYVLFAFAAPSLAGLGSLVALAGAAWFAILAVQMASELKTVTRNEAFVWWPIFVPGYSIYWACVVVPKEVARAKQMRGVQTPVRPLLLYVLLWHYALASDINDLAPSGG